MQSKQKSSEHKILVGHGHPYLTTNDVVLKGEGQGSRHKVVKFLLWFASEMTTWFNSYLEVAMTLVGGGSLQNRRNALNHTYLMHTDTYWNMKISIFVRHHASSFQMLWILTWKRTFFLSLTVLWKAIQTLVCLRILVIFSSGLLKYGIYIYICSNV